MSARTRCGAPAHMQGSKLPASEVRSIHSMRRLARSLARLRLQHQGAGAVRQREAQEIGLHRKPALGVEQRGVLVEARAKPARGEFAGDGRGAFMFARAHRQRGRLQRHHRGRADRLKARKFERRAAKFAMHGAGMTRHQIIALRGRGRKHLQIFAAEAGIGERRLHRVRAHRGVANAAVRLAASARNGALRMPFQRSARCPTLEARPPTRPIKSSIRSLATGSPGRKTPLPVM